MGAREMEAEILHARFRTYRRSMRNQSRPTLAQELMERAIGGQFSCWYWIGYRYSNGYGAYRYAQKHGIDEELAHRLSWIVANGPIPKGMNVLHRCDVRTCINPDHLFLGTQQDNMRDMHTKKRSRWAHTQHTKRAT